MFHRHAQAHILLILLIYVQVEPPSIFPYLDEVESLRANPMPVSLTETTRNRGHVRELSPYESLSKLLTLLICTHSCIENLL